MEHNYEIEKLEAEFLRHWEDSKIRTAEQLKKWTEMNLDTEPPEHFKSNFFHISKALAVICKEITDLKKYIGSKNNI